MQLQRDDIPETVKIFELNNDSYGRYASFDYCYNYFHPSNSNDFTEDIEKSCLAIGFYLASWGMFRGSSFLLDQFFKIICYESHITNHFSGNFPSTSLRNLLRLRSGTSFDFAQEPPSTSLRNLLRLRSGTSFEFAQEPPSASLRNRR